MPPTAPGYSITMRDESLREFAYPDGDAWAGAASPAAARAAT
jgi:L-fuconate dehydratase